MTMTSVLVANRGEIARRVIRGARSLGLRTVAVYVDADVRAPFVTDADVAIRLATGYLDGAAVIEAARRAGADAIHPGYGFLSENADFARAVAAAGLTWVGPPPAVIEAMGDKLAAKDLARSLQVPVLVSSEDPADAENVGFPLLVKAAAGGGGKGMRIVESAADLDTSVASAQREATNAFGDGRVFLERYVPRARHIEIQILGDAHGGLVHLGERECSIQRRNQKVIEEAPSPLLDEATRRKMGEQAVALAKAVNYDSAGTVEFVAGQDRSFFFLEMNTRLQVEHPVTELITGIDLVEQMIRVAAGEPLSIKQNDVKLKGWAVESRIYAEDPTRNFLPSTGRLVKYRPPAEGHDDGVTVRNDTGVFEGGEISIYYDPMIAKLVTHAGDRLTAIDAQARALDAFYIDGIRHNIPFLASLMQHERWRSGALSTGFIAEEYPEGFAPLVAEGETAHVMAAVAAAVDHIANERKRQISGQMRTQRPVQFQRARTVHLGAQTFEIEIDTGDEAVLVRFPGGHAHRLESAWTPGQPVWDGEIDGEQIAVQVRPILNGYAIAHRGVSVDARVFTRAEGRLAALMPEKKGADTSKSLLCPMPGLVKAINVREGQDVKAGEPLCMVEAMKMENVLRAERDVTIKKINAKEGDSLAVDAVIMEFA